ncbi:hypothetical protein V2J09_015742 [Rumex salicifolius]
MAAKPVPPPANPCCAALQLRFIKVEEKRNALRQGCHILKDQLSRLEADNGALKKAFDEERARADHERKLSEKEIAFRISAESKVAELESQLFSAQHAGSSQFENFEKELLILKGKVSEREADIDRLKQLLEEETRRTGVERENGKRERQQVMELTEALEAQNNRAKEACTCNYVDVIHDLESSKATLLQYKEVAGENERKFTEERAYVNNLQKQLEEETVKLKLLQKENIALKTIQESDDAHFATQISEKEAELNQFRNLLQIEKSRVATLQENLELEKNKSLESSSLTQDEAKKAKEGLLQMEILKNEVEKLTLKQLKYEDMSKKYENRKQKVLRERQRADAEKVKAAELEKLVEENEKRFMEEKSNSERLLQQVKEERENVETLKQKIQELLLSDKSNASALSDYSELKEAYLKLETENRKLVKEKKQMERVKAQELKRLAGQNDKKVMEERFNSKQLAYQTDAERQKVEMLQKQVQELLSSAKSTATAHSTYLELKEAHVRLEAQNRMLIKERKCIEAEMGKVDDLRKLSEANEMKYFEEKRRADGSSHELEMSKQKIKKLEEELCSLKLSRKLLGNSTVPDINISTAILLHEQLKLEKKRRKHFKQVLKSEKDRNNELQCGLGKLKQVFSQTMQHLDMLEKTFCGGIQAVDKSTKSSDLSKLQSLYLKELLFGSNQYETLKDGFVVPLSSARHESGPAKPTAVYSQPGNSTESPSGITTKLLPSVGDRVREISPSSPMDSSAASFPDKLFPGSQEQRAVSLPTSTMVVDGNPNLQATILKHSDHNGKRKNVAHVAAEAVDNNTQTPLNSLCAHSKKKRKLFHEFKSLKYMESESRRLHKKQEKKLSKTHSKLNRLMPGQAEYAKILLPDTIASQHDGPHKKRKQDTLNLSHFLAKKIERGKLVAPIPLPAANEGGSAQACIDKLNDQDTLLSFEQQIQGNVMSLLELENEAEEELFRNAIKNPLSPTLPESVAFGALDVGKDSNSKFCNPGSCSIDRGTNNHVDMERKETNGSGIGFQQVGGGAQILSAPVSISDFAKQTNSCKSKFIVETFPHCIFFSYMEEINRISVLLYATKRCLTHCSLHSQTDRILIELLTTLASEQQLTPREKVCVFFTVAMYNFFQVSSNESEVYTMNQGGPSCSFPLFICSALSDAEKRGILAKSFCYSDFLCLFEDFVSRRKIFLCGDKYTDASECTPRFDILLEGKKVVLYEKTASTHQLFAGSVIFSAIYLTVGQISILRDVSFNVLQMCSADPEHILYILHAFAFVCGGKYFLTSNYSIQMEVVKSMVNVLENSPDVQGATLRQSDKKTSHQFPACARCPFAKSLQPVDILSMLVEELGKYASMDALDSSFSLSKPGYAPNKEIYIYIDIMSSVELISFIMGWSWTTDKILPELQKLLSLQSFTQGDFSTSLVILLGRIGRFGVKSCGYEAEGVKSIRQYLSSLLCQIPLLKQNHKFSLALFSALDGISLQNRESTPNKLDCPTDISASSTFMRKCHSSMSSEKKCLISALKQPTSQ